MSLYGFFVKGPRKIKRKILTLIVKASCQKAGKNVTIGNNCSFDGIKNIVFGNDVHIGDNNIFLCTRASIVIGDHFMSGPNVTFVSGDHRIDILDKPMTMVFDKDKNGSEDKEIVFEGDNWVGAGAIILKGVFIGKGSVIAAGSVVTKNVDSYSIVAGCPAKVIGFRNIKKN